MKAQYKKIGTKILDMLYPRICPFCQTIAGANRLICTQCEEHIPFVTEPYCMKCGKPMRQEEERKEYCFDCMKTEHKFERNYSLLVYEKRTKKSLYRFKYQNKREFVTWYTKALYERYYKEIQWIRPDYIIPVPIHKKKKRQRGYNQAELLTRQLSINSNIPQYSNGLIRVIDTLPQKELNNKQRYYNLRNAFAIGNLPEEKGQIILLVDDIYTTGATLDACSSLLLERGYAKKVYTMTIAISKGF